MINFFALVCFIESDFYFVWQVYYKDAKVKQIDVPTLAGIFGILPDHVPTLAVLKPGVLNVFEEDGASKKFFGMVYHFKAVYDNE